MRCFPKGFVGGGHESGVHAPGITDLSTAAQVSHHLLLSHGEAMRVLRESGGERTQVGITLNLSPVHPASEGEADRAAARRFDGYLNRWFLDPVFRGTYPEDLVAWYGDRAPVVREGDLETISARVDFLGVNYYTRSVMAADQGGGFLQARGVKPEGSEYTEMDWEIYPEGLYELLKRVRQEYGIPLLYITESGAAFADEVGPDGQVADPRRAAYLRDHFIQAHRAIQDGIPLAGYFIWSLMDNFEWAFAYSKRFGITYVDYPTQQRILKQSGQWYGQVIRANGVEG